MTAESIGDEGGTSYPAIGGFFAMLAAKGARGPIGELAVLLSSGRLNAADFDAHLDRHGVHSEPWFRRQLLDLVLAFIEDSLSEASLTVAKLDTVRALNHYLGIRDGEFMALRPAEVARILGAQLERILEDDEVSDSEELYQVELQASFGLGYDDYLALTRTAFERAYHDLTLQIASEGSPAREARRKMSALEPVYRLATARTRRLGALY